MDFLSDGLIAGFMLFVIRTGALILSAPVIGTRTGFAGYKLSLILVLSLVLFLVAGEALDPVPDAVDLALLGLREALIGIFLGFLMQLVFLAVRVAGELVGHEMGFMVARQADPATGVQTPLITTFYEGLFVLIFFALNGHHLFVRALDLSYQQAPVGALAMSEGMFETVVGMFGEMFAAGLVFAAPVMIFLMLVSIVLGLLARAVPQLNVLEVGFTLRVGVALCGMFIFAPMLEPAMDGLHEGMIDWLMTGLEAVGI